MANGFDPNKFLEFANHLINDGDYERDCRARTAIGRIYYAPFLLMLQKFSEKGVSIKEREKIHQLVIETCIENGLSTIGNGLDQLREKRVDADYNMMANITLDNCKKQAQLAEYIIGLIGQIKQIRK
jgi:uncharacterized protein (UPF0332 family)